MNNKFWFIPIGILALGLFSCAPKEALSPVALPPIVEVKPEAREGWEVEWERLIIEAKKEKIVFADVNAGAVVMRPLAEAFNRKFGLTLTYVIAPAAARVAKIFRERDSGLFIADVEIGGVATHYVSWGPKGVMTRLDKVLLLPEVLDEKIWKGGWEGLYLDGGKYMAGGQAGVNPLLTRNTQLVGRDEVKTLDDLLNPRWKGKIVMFDPTRPGPGSGIMTVIMELKGEDYIRKLAKQELFITTDEVLILNGLSQGKFAIAIAASRAQVMHYIEVGAPLAWNQPVEGAQLAIGDTVIELFDKAPHPNAAAVFINWFLSKEGQTVLSRANQISSRRADVSQEHIPESFRPRPGVNYIVDTPEIYMKRDRLMELAREVFKD